MHKQMIAAALAAALSVPAAQAALFDFSYQFASGILAGQLEGTLEPDNNTIIVSSISDFVTFNGFPGPSLPYVFSADEVAELGSGLNPVVTLDGSFMDFFACSNSACSTGDLILIAVGNTVATTLFGPTFIFASSTFGQAGTFGEYDPLDWSIAPSAPPPPPPPVTLFDFSYQLANGDILAGQLEGTLQADNNTIVVSSIPDFVTLNGVPGPSLPLVESVDEFYVAGSGLNPVVTLDGSFMDFIACNNLIACDDALVFAVGNLVSVSFHGGDPLYQAGPSFGGTLEDYIQENWSITVVPEPEAYAMMLVGLVLIGVAIRLRTRNPGCKN